MTVVVVDAAAVVDLLCGLPAAGEVTSELEGASEVAAPAHLDAEVLSALARRARSGALGDLRAGAAALASFPARRFPLAPLLAPAVALLDRIAARDALYVALAVSLGGRLVTTDDRLRRAAGTIVEVS